MLLVLRSSKVTVTNPKRHYIHAVNANSHFDDAVLPRSSAGKSRAGAVSIPNVHSLQPCYSKTTQRRAWLSSAQSCDWTASRATGPYARIYPENAEKALCRT